MMDPEPKRCRRTDGKRWRCYLDALDDQKYCARHMHRGSHRSRKHVEVANVDLNSNQVAVDTSRFSSSSVTSPRIAKSISQASASVSTGLHLGVPSSYYNGSTPGNLQTGSASFSCNSTREEKGHQSITVSSFGTLDVQEKTRRECNSDDLKGSGFDQTITSHDSRCNQQNKNNPDVSVAPELCLSPKSVCHSYTGSMNSDYKAGTETDTVTVRCQRTDGKRWQCKKNAVANAKYCESHLHRGAKRTRVVSKMNDHSPGMTLASTVRSHDIPKTSDNNRNLNTDLTISLAVNSGILTVDNTSNNSSSDATTVTDENVDMTSV